MTTDLLTRDTELAAAPSRELAVPDEPSVMWIIAKATMDPNFDVEKLERLMAMKERLDAQKAERELDSALRRFRSGLPQILKTRPVCDKHGKHMYNFANLEDVKSVVDPRLDVCEISYSWDVQTVGAQSVTTCTLRHVGGGTRSSSFPSGKASAPGMTAAQESAATYTLGQRYSLLGVLGLSADHDDDGRGANALPKPDHDPNAPIVPTRSERANEMPHPDQAADPNKITGAMVTQLCKEYFATLSPKVKGTKEMFCAWAKSILRTDLPMDKPSDWNIDAIEACRQNINQPM